MNNAKSLILLLVVSLATAFTARAQSKFDAWPEIKEFHKVMSETFHPSEEGNLKPIRTRSAEMVQQAEKLAASKIPAEFDKAAIREAIAKLVSDSKKLHDMITKNATDVEVTAALSALHDTFHTIVEKCNHSEEGHGHDHGHEGHDHKH
jgi:hypothetical protein